MATLHRSAARPIPRVQRVRRRLSDGNTKLHYYHRVTRQKLPPPGDPAFSAAYELAERRFAQTISNAAGIVSNMPVEQRAAQNTESLREQRDADAASTLTDTPAATLEFFTAEEICSRWRGKITLETLANWRSSKNGPPFTKIGKAILYPAHLLKMWERKNLVSCGLPDAAAVSESDDRPV